jgi:hypothetical protein
MPLLPPPQPPPTTKKSPPTNDLKLSPAFHFSNTTFESLTIRLTPTTRVSFSSIPHDDIINKLNQFNRHPIVKVLSSHQYAYGINILIKIGIYLTAYPPHEESHSKSTNTRQLLYLYWAQIKHV